MCLIRLLVIAVTFAVFSGCTIDPVRNYSETKITDGNRGYALLILGASTHDKAMIHHNVMFRERPNGKQISVLFTKGNEVVTPTPIDLNLESGPAAMYLVPLAAGQYEIYQFRVFRPNILSPETSIPFEVKPGEVTYLGRFMVGFHISRGLSSLGAIYSSSFEEDLILARKKFQTELSSAKAVNSLVPPKSMKSAM